MTDDARPYAKPLPSIGEHNRPFWEGAKRRELRLQRCDDCGHIRYPIAEMCPRCLSSGTTWTAMSGRGSVFSHVVFHQVYDRSFKDDVPYNVVLVQLDEGPRMFSNVTGAGADGIKVGDRLEVAFDDVTPDVTLPRFRVSRG